MGEHNDSRSAPKSKLNIKSLPPFIAVLPCRLESPNYVASVREELFDSLYDFLTHSEEILEFHNSINEAGSTSVSNVTPLIFAAPRTFLPADHKFRRLFLLELFDKVIEVSKIYFRE